MGNARAGSYIEVGRPRGHTGFAGVLLHGRGIAAEGKVDLAARLGNLAGIRWIVPGLDIVSWYPNRFSDPVQSNEPYLTEAVERCREALEEASEDGRLGPEQLALVGFSQGACVALEFALRYPGRAKFIVVLTGALMGPPGSDRRVSGGGTLEGMQIFLTGSDADEWIAEQATRETARALERLGADVALRIYRGRSHIVCEEELAEVRSLLENKL